MAWASVRLSITLLYCIKMVQAKITEFSLWAAQELCFFCDKISCHWVRGFPLNEGVKHGYPLKDLILLLLARLA